MNLIVVSCCLCSPISVVVQSTSDSFLHRVSQDLPLRIGQNLLSLSDVLSCIRVSPVRRWLGTEVFWVIEYILIFLSVAFFKNIFDLVDIDWRIFRHRDVFEVFHWVSSIFIFYWTSLPRLVMAIWLVPRDFISIFFKSVLKSSRSIDLEFLLKIFL